MKSKVKKILNAIVDVLIVLILIVSLLIVVLSLTSKSSGVPNIFGYAPMNVASYSMEPTINKGDLIFSKVTNDIFCEYEVGDIVTFRTKIEDIPTLNTHRIIEVIEDDGITYYKTQGDNKDTNPVADEELQTSATIVAVYTGTKIPVIGNFFGFIRTQLGFFLCVLLPMILFFIYEAIRVILNLLAYNKEKTLAEAQAAVQNAELTEEQKQKAIEEYLASLGQNSDSENK